MSKYKNRKTRMYDVVFDSAAEAERYLALKDMQERGEITSLVLQPEYVILPSFSSRGEHIRSVKYRADFGYIEGDRQVVEDVKGGKATQTPLFCLKAKLFRYRYPDIELRVIER